MRVLVVSGFVVLALGNKEELHVVEQNTTSTFLDVCLVMQDLIQERLRKVLIAGSRYELSSLIRVFTKANDFAK